MATYNPALTPPAATKFTELWYATEEDTDLKQVFGVQSIPVIVSAPEDITYRTLESDTEFSVDGVRPFENINIETLYYKEQQDELKALEKSKIIPWWYVKLPDITAGTSAGAKPDVIKWRGTLAVALSEIPLDDMIRATLTIGKTTVPEIIDGLPGTGI